MNIEDIKMQLLVSVADARLITLDATQRAGFNRARHSGRQRQFFMLPEEYDMNSSNDVVVDSVIAWSFYPKLLTREGKGWRNVSNNQSVALLPTSVNKKADWSVRWVSYYSIMQARSRAYNAQETSVVDDFAVALLCGDSEFRVCLFYFVCRRRCLTSWQMYAGVISIDSNRIRFSARDWKSMLALKTLSGRLREILTGRFRNPQRMLSHREQQWMDIWQQVFQQAGKRAVEATRGGGNERYERRA